jgi:hypothetical protein
MRAWPCGPGEGHGASRRRSVRSGRRRHFPITCWRPNDASPLSSHATASPSMMHDRERRPVSGNLSVCGKARRDESGRLGNQREAASRVIAGAAVEPHAVAILACDNPEAMISCSHLAAGGCGRQRLGGATVARARFSRLTNGCAWNAVSAFANCGRAVAHVRGS